MPSHRHGMSQELMHLDRVSRQDEWLSGSGSRISLKSSRASRHQWDATRHEGGQHSNSTVLTALSEDVVGSDMSAKDSDCRQGETWHTRSPSQGELARSRRYREDGDDERSRCSRRERLRMVSTKDIRGSGKDRDMARVNVRRDMVQRRHSAEMRNDVLKEMTEQP